MPDRPGGERPGRAGDERAGDERAADGPAGQEQAGQEQAGEGQALEGPSPEGLDLARAQARATARLPGTPARRRTGKAPGGSVFRPRSRSRSTSSGAHPDDRDPQALGSALERLVASHGWQTDLQVQSVFARWAELVGEEVGSHSTPETLDDGRLVVRTDSTAWATQLRLLAPQLVRRLNEELGHGTVLVIEVLGPHLPTWKKGLRSTRGRGPRDTYG